MIEVVDLEKAYGERTAIHKLNFKIGKGEVVGFLGPNGAGKTTTMKIITGFMAPTSGQVTVAGFDVFENPIEVKKRIGYLPETPPLYPDMRVADYLEFVAQLKAVPSAKIAQRVAYSIEKLNLGEVRKRMIGNLSKGFRQRVGIAQAVVNDPEVLIMDEPTVGLDPHQVAEFRGFVRELAGHHTVILSTHIMSEVQASCQKVIIINRGQIVAQDSIEGLGRQMATGGARVIVRVSGGGPELETKLRSLTGVRSVAIHGDTLTIETDGNDSVPQTIATQIVTAGVGLLEIRSERASLEDVFLKLTSTQSTSQGVLA